MDFRAALILLPTIFKENVDHHIMMGEVWSSSTLVFFGGGGPSTISFFLFWPNICLHPCLLCCILQGEHNTPYPIVQVTQEDWKSTFEGRSSCSLKVDRVEVCEGMKVEEARISSFYSYFVFNLEYQPKNKNTLTFLQRCIAKINVKGDRPLPTTVTRVINLLF